MQSHRNAGIRDRFGRRNIALLGTAIGIAGTLVIVMGNQYLWIVFVGRFIQGLGMTLLQAASNPYITILGPIESAAKRIAIMGIANKVAGALGSVIFGAILLSGIDDIKEKIKNEVVKLQAKLIAYKKALNLS